MAANDTPRRKASVIYREGPVDPVDHVDSTNASSFPASASSSSLLQSGDGETRPREELPRVTPNINASSVGRSPLAAAASSASNELARGLVQEAARRTTTHIQETPGGPVYSDPPVSDANLKRIIAGWQDPVLPSRKVSKPLVGQRLDAFTNKLKLPGSHFVVPLLELPLWFDNQVSRPKDETFASIAKAFRSTRDTTTASAITSGSYA
jgi:hypothetical protein